ncbi:large-conductance mechanosensitive channel [Polychytrium aggregatum]|uniref:large-conductance mechanosensitive channel n=1 Tax=Polychytrium aggregatum TaxID=110093 RepID=UPI0022FE9EAB|nr:large-conductance mechanosensitive channel [Polychytrium aggregatum]KAI9206673.1 large-conductance mechanosensitive channel [Polychytrium aggregatum]
MVRGISVAEQTAHRLWDDFHAFLKLENVVELSVGVIVGGAFSNIMSSFIRDRRAVPADCVSTLIDTASQMENNFSILKCPANATECSGSWYNTVNQAHDAGAITLNWGRFCLSVMNFFSLSVVLWILMKLYVKAFRRKNKKRDETSEEKKRCEFCLIEIHALASRCPHCTSILLDNGATSMGHKSHSNVNLIDLNPGRRED